MNKWVNYESGVDAAVPNDKIMLTWAAESGVISLSLLIIVQWLTSTIIRTLLFLTLLHDLFWYVFSIIFIDLVCPIVPKNVMMLIYCCSPLACLRKTRLLFSLQHVCRSHLSFHLLETILHSVLQHPVRFPPWTTANHCSRGCSVHPDGRAEMLVSSCAHACFTIDENLGYTIFNWMVCLGGKVLSNSKNSVGVENLLFSMISFHDAVTVQQEILNLMNQPLSL